MMERHRIAYGRHALRVVAFVIHEDAIEIIRVFQIAHRAVGYVDEGVHVFVAI